MTLHYITLHYITLHYITLHYTTVRYIHIHIHTYIYIHTYIHTYIHIHAYRYTHIHTHTVFPGMVSSLGLNPSTAPYWVLGAALNYAYAEEHGHGFHLARPLPREGPKILHGGWNRVLYINQFLDTQSREECKWVLYLDTDAFVRSAFDLRSIVQRLLAKYQRPDDCRSSAVFAVEQEMVSQNITAPGGSPITVPGASSKSSGVPSEAEGIAWVNLGCQVDEISDDCALVLVMPILGFI